jgi:hypothetical protein
MSRTKSLKSPCQRCGGRLEFPAEMIGTTTQCPHCGQSTELVLAAPAPENPVSRQTILWSLVAVLILGLGLAGSLVALKRAQRMAAQHKLQPGSKSGSGGGNSQTNTLTLEQEAAAKAGFQISSIVLEEAAGSSLVYAVGSLTNNSPRQRFGIKLELDLFDAADQKVGTAKDYQATMEPGASWRFKALVVEPKAASVKLSSIKEDQ